MIKQVLIPVGILFCFVTTIFGQDKAEGKTCKDCHSDKSENKFMHYPAEDACDNCHMETGNEHPGDELGFDLADEMPGLCFLCHEEFKGDMLHGPVEMGECLMCHSPHGSENPSVLMTKSPDLCFDCHDTKDIMESSPVVHGAANSGKSCMNCHSPHASSEPRLFIEEERKLCLSCHIRSVTKDGQKLAAIGRMLDPGHVVHGVFEEEGCSVCHKGHASSEVSLLNAAFPAGLYASGKPENFELCFTCHDPGLMEEENTSWATEFRDGERNLHYVHMHGEKARSCKLCHSVHGSHNQFMIADMVTFGNWDMPMGFTPVENGGSCSTGCHTELSYSRTVQLP